MKKIIKRSYFFCMLSFMCFTYFCCTSTVQIPRSNNSNQKSLITNKKSLDSILKKYVDNGSYPFLYARLESIDGAILYEKSVINKSLIPNKNIGSETWIRIWSMSKIVTITVAMDLLEDGILSLDDPVTKYIPEFQNLEVAVDKNGNSLATVKELSLACPFDLVPVDSVMTVGHLINHLAGFYYATTDNKCINEILADKNLPSSRDSQELINKLASLPLLQHPGQKDFYGTNTTVLGLVAERATKKSLETLVIERLTGPLGINGLKYNLSSDEELLPRFTGKDSVLRLAKDGELDIFGPDVPSNNSENKLFLGGEGMVATAAGYSEFLRMLLNRGKLNGNQFLSSETIDQITSPQTQLTNPWGYNGYNIWVTGDSLKIKGWGDSGLWQGGGYEGTQFWIDPKRKFVGLIMSQIHSVPNNGWAYYNEFRGELYKQIFENE